MDAALEIRGLGKRYPGFSLQDVSFTVPRGTVMGLIGPNGAGKTTTLGAILGTVRRDAGEVRVLGVDPSEDGSSVRARIGFVHDEPRFYRHLSLAANAKLVSGFYPSWDGAVFRRLASDFGLPLRKAFGKLSRGNRTRFALAIALAHHAELIVLDEPTTGLDPAFRRELLDELADQLEGARASIVFSTHITADLDRVADYVTLLQNGRAVFSLEKDLLLDTWGVVKGGLELLEEAPFAFLRGVHRRAHGFEALVDDADAARKHFGSAAIVERPTLEDVLLYTTTAAMTADKRGDARRRPS